MIFELTADELGLLAPLGEAFYLSSTVLGTFDPAQFEATWRQILAMGLGVVYASTVDGKIVGAIGGMRHKDANSADMIATEMFWFVDPLRRGDGLKLYDAFEDWAKSQGCQQLQMVHLADSMPAKLERFYERKGYRKLEVRYGKEL
jgi:GNAT superfamily N-acetyltransferase